jgi:DNA processing protein
MKLDKVSLNFDLDDPVLAAAAWTRLIEPVDEIAGTLLAEMGAGQALLWLTEVASSNLTDRALVDSALASRDAAEALSVAVTRWATRLDGLDPIGDLKVLERAGGTLLLPDDPRWPAGLNDLEAGCPPALWVVGDASLAATCERSVALVGARASTAYGEHVTSTLVSGLVDRGFAIVSGGAYGIDAAAHRATLMAGGRTVAVMAGGVDRLYPRGNDALLRRVVSDGAVITEAPPGTSPMKHRFLSRNRLIAAMTGATVVVEAAWRSGALSTARHAAALLRPVGAVPGPVTSMASGGTNQLLRDGIAVCVTDAAEVAELAGSAGRDAAPDRSTSSDPQDCYPTDGLDAGALAVIEAFPTRGAVSADALIRQAGRPLGEILAALGILELRGLIRSDGSKWRRVPQVGVRGGVPQEALAGM